MIQTGTAAPAFELPDTEKNMHKLSDYRGKNVVLLFFPMAFTGVCTKELCSMRDDIGSYEKLNAIVIGISVDSPFTLAKFKEDQQFNFPLLSDFNKQAIQAYDCMYAEFVAGLKGVAKRSAFVIDREGMVRYAEVLESAGDLPNFDAVKQTLSTLS